MGPTDTGDTSGERKVERYREAAHAALDQLDWIIGFCTAFGSRGSPTLSKRTAKPSSSATGFDTRSPTTAAFLRATCAVARDLRVLRMVALVSPMSP
jgi:hypothetical protein